MENFPINLNILKSYYILIILHTYDQSKEKKKKSLIKVVRIFIHSTFFRFRSAITSTKKLLVIRHRNIQCRFYVLLLHRRLD